MAHSAKFEEHLSDRRFELLINSVTDYAIYMLDPQGQIVTWNPGAERFKGYTADEIIGHHFSRFFTDDDRESDLPGRALRIAAREGRFESEGWRVRKDGGRFWAHVVLDPVRGEHGELLGFVKITRDVTERRERERALFESEQRFRMLVQGVHDYAIYMLDRDGRVTNWNSGARSIKGYEESEIVGQHFSRFYTEQDRSQGEPQRALQTALSQGKYEREAWRVRKDGSLFWAHVLIDPIYDENGQHVGFAKVTRDATEKKRAEEKLRETQAALLQAQKLQALGELTGGIAHDFNNLMTVIAGSVELLLKRPDLPDEKRDRYLRAIAETADRATTLTGQLLAFGRRQTLKPEVLDLNIRLDAFSEMIGRTLGSRHQLKLDLAPSLGRIEADPTGLETAVLNAVINARDAMPDGGVLTIATENRSEPDCDKVVVAIHDTGQGMDKETLERVFEPFFTTKPVGKGTGLGLSQIHGFAAQSGGRAEIESELGRGTTVRIFLPQTTMTLTEAKAPERSALVPEGLRVLLIEDNEQVRQFARNMLEELRCEVIEAPEANTGLSILRDEKVDLVFSDIVMPGMSGLELARLIREEFPQMPVLLATGYSEDLRAGNNREFQILSKPYRPDAVANAIATAISPCADEEEAAE